MARSKRLNKVADYLSLLQDCSVVEAHYSVEHKKLGLLKNFSLVKEKPSLHVFIRRNHRDNVYIIEHLKVSLMAVDGELLQKLKLKISLFIASLWTNTSRIQLGKMLLQQPCLLVAVI